MRKISVLLLAAFLLAIVPSFAEEDYATLEVFGGYNLLNEKRDDHGGGIGSYKMNGWNLAFTRNTNSFFGMKVEASGAYRSGEEKENWYHNSPIKKSYSTLSYMTGPQISLRNVVGPVTPFAYFLVGIANFSEKWEGEVYTSKHPAIAFGGGADVSLGELLAIRGQCDYSPTIILDTAKSPPDANVRVAVGVVFKLFK